MRLCRWSTCAQLNIEQKFNFGDNDNPELDEIEKNDIIRVQENSNELSKNVNDNLSHPPNDEIGTSVSGGKLLWAKI